MPKKKRGAMTFSNTTAEDIHIQWCVNSDHWGNAHDPNEDCVWQVAIVVPGAQLTYDSNEANGAHIASLLTVEIS